MSQKLSCGLTYSLVDDEGERGSLSDIGGGSELASTSRGLMDSK
jgi:hypothetical protein